MSRPLFLLLASALIVSCGADSKSTEPSATASIAETIGPTTVDSTVATTGADTSPPTTPLTTKPPVPTLPAEQVAQLVGERPYNTFVPSSYDAATPMPLVLVLHGFKGSSAEVENYLQFRPLAEERGFIYVLPEGTENDEGEQFWNATDACCGGGSTIDDSTYLRAVIDDLKAELTIDERRVYIVGHSNGGFMAYRLACEHSETIAAIVSLAGATFTDPGECTPSEPVSVLQVHGAYDTVIYFEGGTYMGPYPSATQTVQTWSQYNTCTASDTTPFDLDPNSAGEEAVILSFRSCDADVAVELWTVEETGHAPLPTTAMATLIDFLYAHPKS